MNSDYEWKHVLPAWIILAVWAIWRIVTEFAG